VSVGVAVCNVGVGVVSVVAFVVVVWWLYKVSSLLVQLFPPDIP